MPSNLNRKLARSVGMRFPKKSQDPREWLKFLKRLRDPKWRNFEPQTKWNIVRGDKVQVVSGKEKGKQGIVKEVYRYKNRLIVEGVNYRNRGVRPAPGRKGTLVKKESTLHVASVALIDPVTGKPTRVARRYLESGEKVRVAKKSGAVIPKNMDVLKKRRDPRHPFNPETDTPKEMAAVRTYFPPSDMALLLERARLGKLRYSFMEMNTYEMAQKLRAKAEPKQAPTLGRHRWAKRTLSNAARKKIASLTTVDGGDATGSSGTTTQPSA